MPLVDVRDVAEVGFKALTEDGHAGQAVQAGLIIRVAGRRA